MVNQVDLLPLRATVGIISNPRPDNRPHHRVNLRINLRLRVPGHTRTTDSLLRVNLLMVSTRDNRHISSRHPSMDNILHRVSSRSILKDNTHLQGNSSSSIS